MVVEQCLVVVMMKREPDESLEAMEKGVLEEQLRIELKRNAVHEAAIHEGEEALKILYLLYRAQMKENALLAKRTEALLREKEGLERRVIYGDVIGAAQQSLSFSEMVRLFHEGGIGISHGCFIKKLKAMGMVSRRDGYTPTKLSLKRGYLEVRWFVKNPHLEGVVTLGSMVRITPKGQRYFFRRMLEWRAKQAMAVKRIA